MKDIVASILAGDRKLQDRWLKLATYSRFSQWTQANPAPRVIPGGPREKRNNLFEIVADQEELARQEILYAEFGVHKGESISWWKDKNTISSSIFLGFDSFVGLPEDWVSGRQKGTFSRDGEIPHLGDQRVRFVPGWFQETLPAELSSFETKSRKVVHMDADLYRSTIYPLLLIGPHIKQGDILIFDEFLDSIHEFRAFEDFQTIFSYDFEILAATPGHAQVALKRIG